MESREGRVLRAYRDPVGIWTIGAGLTAASGVISPRAGMTISEAEASRLLGLALSSSYEPAVRRALGAVTQHAFDGAVSFHFNTGAISRASWVKSYLSGNMLKVPVQLGRWRKGGGRVLPGLVRRRREEADIILQNKWPADLDAAKPSPRKPGNAARFVISVTAVEIEDIRTGFQEMGFDPGPVAGEVRVYAVKAFQLNRNLAIDGLIGRATLSTLQRELDARKAVIRRGGAATLGGGTAAVNQTTVPTTTGDQLVTWIGGGVLLIAALGLIWLAWAYRDLVAVRIQRRAPRIAAWLRSF